MCDSFVTAGGEGAQVWLAKNSDREPGEAQVVEHLPPRRARTRRLSVTHIDIDEVDVTREVVLSRPAWMWGAEMGVNDAGLAVANEAIFTRVPPAATGLTGMDMVRLALERAASADEALEIVTSLLARYGQGGRCGYRDRGFRYDNAFFFADRAGAWLLETAGPYWVAARVAGARWASNAVSIGTEHERMGKGTEAYARERGWHRSGARLDFRRSFGARVMSVLSGGDRRRRDGQGGSGDVAELSSLSREIRDMAFSDAALRVAARLRRHHAGDPRRGARLLAPCAHASFLPTRRAGQTTGTMIARLTDGGPTVAFTGTSAPCISVLKRVPLGGVEVDTGPSPRKDGYDEASLFWRHERLHRATLRDYDARRRTFEPARAALEARGLEAASSAAATGAWEEHRARALEWYALATAQRPSRLARPTDAYWSMMSRMDGIPR